MFGSFCFFLESTFNFSAEEINKIVLSQPKLFAFKVQRLDVVNYLVPFVHVRAMVKHWPTLLTYSVPGLMQPGITFLQLLGTSSPEIPTGLDAFRRNCSVGHLNFLVN
jgi:hypothetical protein